VRLVYEATQRGDHAQAAELAQQALARGLEHPLLYNVAALALDQAGELAQALELLDKAVRAWPDDLGLRNALGLTLLRLERPAAALDQFEALLRLNPDLAFAHTSRGNAMLALGAITEAELSFKRALQLDPQQPIAYAGLARIATDRGNYRDAQYFAERALALVPGYPDALMSLAAAELREHHAKRAEERLRALLGDVRLSERERAYAQGLLGDTLDAQQRQEDAFAAYSACNQHLQHLYADQYRGADNALEYVRAITSYFERARPEDWKLGADFSAGSGTLGHVFVLGFPRSGTTLLEVILEGHPDVVSLEENELLIGSVREFMRTSADLERLRRAGAAELAAASADYWRLVAAAGVSVAGKIFVDKHPLNTLKLPLIARLFPHAKILFACRDPRDIVLSCFRHRFRMSAPIFELLTIEGAARYYDAVMQLLIRLTSVFALDVCLVRHEDVVTEFAREMKRVCDFLGLEWAPPMGDFALRTQSRPVLTPSTAQLVRGLSTEGVGQWRRYRSQLAPVQSVLAPWTKRFYYDPQ
jgi:Tfp pilus assembly protein PilF